MPGIITHTFAGIIVSVIGRVYYKDFLDYKYKKQLIFIITCLTFSVLPDVFLGIYYTTHILDFNVLANYHRITHMLFPIVAIIFLILARSDKKRQPYWAIALTAIIVHLIMDLLIIETGPFF